MENILSNTFKYTDAGLDNVIVIQPEPPAIDDMGERTFVVRNLPGLHAAIASAIIGKDRQMSGGEFRFLRTEMGLTQAELGRIVHREGLTVSRWEREESPIDEMADVLVRILAREKLEIQNAPTIEHMSELAVARAGAQRAIWIDGRVPDEYVRIDEAEVPDDLKATGTLG